MNHHQELCLSQRNESTQSQSEHDSFKHGSLQLNDSLSSLESIGSWIRPTAKRLSEESTPVSPAPKSPGGPNFAADHCVPPMTPHKKGLKESILKGSTPATPKPSTLSLFCTSPSSSPVPLGASPGRPPRPPLLKKRSRRGILRSTRASSSRRSLLSSKSSNSSSSRSPASGGPLSSTRSRSIRRKRPSPLKVKRVSFQLPDDSSVESSMDGSLLRCDVETINNIGDELTMEENELYHQSCRIVLPFMNGLDSDDEFEFEDDDDDDGEGGIPASMDEWFNSTGDMAFSFDSFRADKSFSDEEFETPRRGKRNEQFLDIEGDHECFNRSFNMKTPTHDGFSFLPAVDVTHKTPVLSNLHATFPDLESDDDPKLPTLTPVPDRESSCPNQLNKESPTSVMELCESQCNAKSDSNAAPQNEGNLVYDIDQCAERFSSVKLATEDILVRDLGHHSVTPSQSDPNSSAFASSVSSGNHSTTASPLGRRTVVQSPILSPKGKVYMGAVSSPVARPNFGRRSPLSPLGRAITSSPVSRIGTHRPGRGL